MTKNSFLAEVTFKVVSKPCDQKEQILTLDIVLNGINILLSIFYNSNSEPDQICILSTLQKLLKK